MTLNQIKKLFKQSISHNIIHTFAFGSIDNVAIDETVFPLFNSELLLSNKVSDYEIERQYNIHVLDLVEDDLSNVDEVLNDTELYCNSIINYLSNVVDVVDGTTNIQEYTDLNDDLIYGYVISITFQSSITSDYNLQDSNNSGGIDCNSLSECDIWNNYYNKTEIDTLLEDIVAGDIDLTSYLKIADVGNYASPNQNLSPYILKSEILNYASPLQSPVDVSNYYTKNEVNNLISPFIDNSDLTNYTDAFDIDEYYDKDTIDSLLSALSPGGSPIDLSNYITSPQAHNAFQPIGNYIISPFSIDLSNYYDKDEVNNLVSPFTTEEWVINYVSPLMGGNNYEIISYTDALPFNKSWQMGSIDAPINNLPSPYFTLQLSPIPTLGNIGYMMHNASPGPLFSSDFKAMPNSENYLNNQNNFISFFFDGDYVQYKIENVNAIDLSNYYTKTETDNLISPFITPNTIGNYASPNQDLSNYITSPQAHSAFQPIGDYITSPEAHSAFQPIGDYITSPFNVDLSPYILKDEILNYASPLQSPVDLSGYYTKSESDNLFVHSPFTVDLSPYATEEWAMNYTSPVNVITAITASPSNDFVLTEKATADFVLPTRLTSPNLFFNKDYIIGYFTSPLTGALSYSPAMVPEYPGATIKMYYRSTTSPTLNSPFNYISGTYNVSPNINIYYFSYESNNRIEYYIHKA